MSVFLMILLSILPQIIQYLISLINKKATLNDRQRQHLNQVLFLNRQLEEHAVTLGCKPGGEEAVLALQIVEKSSAEWPE